MTTARGVMPDSHESARTTGVLLIAFILSTAALYFGAEFFVPIAFAFLLNALFRPPVRALEAMRVPAPAGAAVVVLALVAAFCGACWLLRGPVERWVAE